MADEAIGAIGRVVAGWIAQRRGAAGNGAIRPEAELVGNIETEMPAFVAGLSAAL